MSSFMKEIRKAALDTVSEIRDGVHKIDGGSSTPSTPETINTTLGAKTFITPQREETTKIDILQLKNSSIIADGSDLEIR